MEQASLAANATPNVVVVSAVPGATTSLTNAANVIFTTANMSNMSTTGIPVSVVSGLTQPAMASTLAAAEQLSTVTIDLNASAAAAAAGQQASPAAVAEETNGGVLLCNLDELSRLVVDSWKGPWRPSFTSNYNYIPTPQVHTRKLLHRLQPGLKQSRGDHYCIAGRRYWRNTNYYTNCRNKVDWSDCIASFTFLGKWDHNPAGKRRRLYKCDPSTLSQGFVACTLGSSWCKIVLA